MNWEFGGMFWESLGGSKAQRVAPRCNGRYWRHSVAHWGTRKGTGKPWEAHGDTGEYFGILGGGSGVWWEAARSTEHTGKPPGTPESSGTCQEAPGRPPAEEALEAAGRQRELGTRTAPGLAPLGLASAVPPPGPGPHLLHLPGQGHQVPGVPDAGGAAYTALHQGQVRAAAAAGLRATRRRHHRPAAPRPFRPRGGASAEGGARRRALIGRRGGARRKGRGEAEGGGA